MDGPSSTTQHSLPNEQALGQEHNNSQQFVCPCIPIAVRRQRRTKYTPLGLTETVDLFLRTKRCACLRTCSSNYDTQRVLLDVYTFAVASGKARASNCTH